MCIPILNLLIRFFSISQALLGLHHLPLHVPLVVPHAALVASYEEGVLAVLTPTVRIFL